MAAGSMFRKAAARAITAVGGPGATATVKVVMSNLGLTQPAPGFPQPDFGPTYTPPRDGEIHGMLGTPDGAVRVVPARGQLPNSNSYPAAPPAPRVPRRKSEVPLKELKYLPVWHTEGHPTHWEFPAFLDNPGCQWLQGLKRLYANPLSFPSSLSPEGGLLVHSLIRNIRPRLVIETGTFVGVSTIWIAAALKENGDGGVIHTFDDFGPIKAAPWREVELKSGRLEFVARNVTSAGLADQVVFHPGNSPFEIRAAQEEFNAAGGCQLAFLDADHGIVGAWHDLWATEPVLNTGGFVLLHDTFPHICSYDGPRNVLDNINKNAVGRYEKLDMYLSPINYGLGLIRRIG
ncbi:MAG: class I SAM-dependent methyltransferase [Phycisphaeraceae bacterium]|nr:class I SAM-dependent methyltransferase [Phycisphaeraceae bacterium]